jgi:hypothetical protein
VPEAQTLTPSGAISAARLREGNVTGGFPAAISAMLTCDPRRIHWAVRIVAFEVGLSAKTSEVLRAFGLDPA